MRPVIKGKSGFAIAEALVALVVGLLSFWAFMQVFDNSYRHSAESRNHALATVVAQNLLAEVSSHPYGAPAPASWDPAVEEKPVRIWVQNRPVDTRFKKTFAYHNQSFIGNSTADSDVVTIVVSWTEVGQLNHITVRMPVWR